MEVEKEERRWCVYIHTSPSNKAYIGITCHKPEDRFGHNGCKYNKEHQPAIASAIKYYGWDNFQHEIFATDLTESEAKHMEVLLIALFQTNCNRYYNPSYGYNLTDGGDGSAGRPISDERRKLQSEMMKNRFSDPTNHPMYGKSLSEETKKKISESRKGQRPSDETRKKLSESRTGEKNPNYGKKMSDEQKRAISESKKGKYYGESNPNYGNHKLAGENHPNYGRPMSDEQKQKISESRIGKYGGAKNPRAKPVIQLTKDLKFIREWSYITEASNTLHISRSAITRCVNHHQEYACGFKWILKSEYNDLLLQN